MLTVIVIIMEGICAVLTVIVTIMEMSICSANSYCGNNEEVYMQC